MKKLTPLFCAVLACLPGLWLRLSGVHLDPQYMALISGASILGASFLLLWACDVAQADIPQTLALAVVALIAVLPEYAVDMYFTWQAGQHPESNYAHYAIANMTGANRLLIGVAWAAVAAIFWMRTRRRVELSPDRRTEILFLGLATAYAMVIPLKGSLTWIDGVVLVSLYAWYIVLAGRRPCEECEMHGPAEVLAALATPKRRLATAGLFLFAAAVILADAEIFSEGLVATGKVLGVDEFLLVQWLAPIASEAPEFIVAIMLVLRGDAGTALGSLLSAKLNQWTLLVGMIPFVFAAASGSTASPIPMDSFQLNEILLTVSQSLLAVGLLAGLTLGPRGAVFLFALFAGQLTAPLWAEGLSPALAGEAAHQAFSAMYLASFAALAILKRRELAELRLGLKVR